MTITSPPPHQPHVDHYYFDVLANNPGQEIIEVEDGRITVLDAHGRVLETPEASVTDPQGFINLIGYKHADLPHDHPLSRDHPGYIVKDADGSYGFLDLSYVKTRVEAHYYKNCIHMVEDDGKLRYEGLIGGSCEGQVIHPDIFTAKTGGEHLYDFEYLAPKTLKLPFTAIDTYYATDKAWVLENMKSEPDYELKD